MRRSSDNKQGATTWAIVPLKSPRHAKTRLAGALTVAQREWLFFELAQRVIRALQGTRRIETVAVVTADEQVAAFARALSAQTIMQTHESGTAAAFADALRDLESLPLTQVLMIAGDLPLISTAAVEQVLTAGTAPSSTVIVPDRHRLGTNALLCAPPNLLPPCFGESSFSRHLAAAQIAGVPLRVLEVEELALDLDTAEDLEDLQMRSGPEAKSLQDLLYGVASPLRHGTQCASAGISP